MSYSKLKGRIREKFGKQEPFARAMDMDPSTLSKKLNNGSQWTRPEIEKACELLEIPISEAHDYFFCSEC